MIVAADDMTDSSDALRRALTQLRAHLCEDNPKSPDDVLPTQDVVKLLRDYTRAQYGGRGHYSKPALAREILQLGWPRDPQADKHRRRCHLHAAGGAIADTLGLIRDVQDREHLAAYLRTLRDTVVDLLSFEFPTIVTRRRIPHALESHRLARINYMGVDNRHTLIGSLSSMSVSCFLLRQAIELRLFQAFGVESVLTSDGRPAKPQRGLSYKRVLLDVLKEHGGLPDGLSITTLQLVEAWCNLSVHSGWRCYTWEFMLAEAVVRPLFIKGCYGGEEKLEGSIKLSEQIIAQGIRMIKAIMPPESSLIRGAPGCFIVPQEEVPKPQA